MPLLAVSQLEKHFPVRHGFRTKRLHALRDVTFSVERGEVVALVGESGSGKSTAARLIAGLYRPSAGEVIFEGKTTLRARRPTKEFRSKVQMIFQDPFGSLNPVHTLGYHLERPLYRHGKARSAGEAREKASALLESVGLTPGNELALKYPHQVSGGQRQRVAIARALAVEPALILADEPISMLDVSIRIGVLNLLRELKDRRGLAYLYITHDLASARHFGDRTIVMYAGRIVESAPSRELMKDAQHPYTRLLLSAMPDPRRATRRPLAATSGAPKRFDPPPGCAFLDRCPDAIARCRDEVPALVTLGGGRSVRCHVSAP